MIPAILFTAAITIGAGKQPQIDVRGQNVALVFGSGNTIYYAGSKDGGKSFSVPTKVAEPNGLMLGRHRGPRIALAGDLIVVTAIAGGQLSAWRSGDGGRSWSDPVTVNSVRDAAREGLHGLSAAPDGRVLVTWLDLREKGTRLYGAVSTNGGATWSANFPVYSSPDGHICECCHPSALVGLGHTLYAMWRNWLGGSRDLWYATSQDDGRTWVPAKLGEGTWPLEACPMDGGDLVLEAPGKLRTVWRRENKIYLDSPGEAEREIGTGKDPNLSFGPGGVYAAWTSADGKLMLARPNQPGAEVLAEQGAYPVLDGPIAVWEQDGKVMLARLAPEQKVSESQSALERAHAGYSEALAEKTFADLEYRRVSALVEKGDLPAVRGEQARVARDAAAERAEEARKRLSTLESASR